MSFGILYKVQKGLTKALAGLFGPNKAQKGLKHLGQDLWNLEGTSRRVRALQDS